MADTPAAPPPPGDGRVEHASCIAVNGRGLLIRGPSGSGKSGLSLALMALGADLVADDGVCLRRQGDQIIASAPPAIRNLIEARGLGLLRAHALPEAPLAAVLDLGTHEDQRLPPLRHTSILQQNIELLHKVDSPHFPAAILHYLKYGRMEV